MNMRHPTRNAITRGIVGVVVAVTLSLFIERLFLPFTWAIRFWLAEAVMATVIGSLVGQWIGSSLQRRTVLKILPSDVSGSLLN